MQADEGRSTPRHVLIILFFTVAILVSTMSLAVLRSGAVVTAPEEPERADEAADIDRVGDDADLDASDDPGILVVRRLTAARNGHDLDGVLAAYAPEAHILGWPRDHERLGQRVVDRFAAQFLLEWRVTLTDCERFGDRVVCDVVMDDVFLRALGIRLTGRHTYELRDGLIARHDGHVGRGRRAAEAAVADLRAWVRVHHPELEPVMWSDPAGLLATTPEGAEALLAVLDDWLAQRPLPAASTETSPAGTGTARHPGGPRSVRAPTLAVAPIDRLPMWASRR